MFPNSAFNGKYQKYHHPLLLLLLFCPACLCPCPALHTCSLHSCGFLLAACVPPSSALAPAAASPPACRGAGGRPQPLPCSHPSSSSCPLAAGASPTTLQLCCLPLSAAPGPAPVLPGLRFTGCIRESGAELSSRGRQRWEGHKGFASTPPPVLFGGRWLLF